MSALLTIFDSYNRCLTTPQRTRLDMETLNFDKGLFARLGVTPFR